MDEFGAAGHLPDVQRLFTQGRSFGVSIVAGLQEISSLEAVYGENVADTILGQFSYKACLKSGSPKTQEWMSKQFGERLEKLTKETHGEQTSHDVTKGQSEGTSSNKTDGTSRTYSKQHSEAEGRSEAKTKGSSQTSSADWKVKNTTTTQDGTQTSTNRQTTDGTQKSKGVTTQSSHGSTHTDSSSERSGTSSNSSTTWELRKDFNIYGSEFGDFKSPTTTGLIAGVYMAPSFTGWRADLPFTIFKSAYERQEALDLTPAIKPWPDKWEASRPKTWSSEDYDRLGMEIPNHIAAAPLTEQLALPSAEEKPPSEAAPPAKEDLEKSWPLEDFQFEEYD